MLQGLFCMAVLASSPVRAFFRQDAPAAFPMRRLGGLEVSALGLGCMSMNSGNYNPPRDAKDMIRVIHAAVDCGVSPHKTQRLKETSNNHVTITFR